jgi:hypothetical protein
MWPLLLLTSLLSVSPGQTPPSTRVDVSALKIGAPVTVAELDLGRLKGELRQVAWSPDGSELYVQTVEGSPPAEKLHHYKVTAAGGAIAPLDQQADWAREFWPFKSDRSAPGIPAMTIGVEHGTETTKGLPPEGSVRGTGVSAADLANSSSPNATANVIRLGAARRERRRVRRRAADSRADLRLGAGVERGDRFHRSRRPVDAPRPEAAQAHATRGEGRHPAGVVDGWFAAGVGPKVRAEEIRVGLGADRKVT